MSNQTSKVIATSKGKFKNAIPAIVAWIILIIITVIAHIALNKCLGEFANDSDLFAFAQIFVGFCKFLISLVMLIFAIAFTLMIIAHIVDNATLTETGIYGRNNDFRKFDLTFDQILSIQQVKKSVIIFYTNEKGSKKRMAIYLEEAKEFAEACNAQLAAYKK
ncbi:MAG: hypothetical protein II330_05950 [Clostridia bacterium]|nr:hypothetical protein [Clostridia bacterium]